MTELQKQEKIFNFNDVGQNGNEQNWRGRKLANLKLADSYNKLNYKSSMIQRVAECAEVLTFIQKDDGTLRLNQTWFCKNKLCPMCNWRRSLKYSYQATKIVDEAMKRNPKARFIFLTLTIENVPASELNKSLSELTKSFDRLFKRRKIQKNLIGFLRATEVTVEEKRNGYYHPHLHVLMMMKSNYFKIKGDYIKQQEWAKLWQESAQLLYTPIVDVKAVKAKDTEIFDKDSLKKAVLETAKYPTKPISFDDENLKIIDDLYKGLYRKRQIAYGGLFKQIAKELRFDDVENGDLIVVDEETGEITNGTKLVAVWNWERKNYFLK